MKKLLSLNLVVLFITAVLIIFSTSCSQKIEQASIKNTTSTKDVPVSFDSVNLMRIYRDLATMQINLLNDIVNSSIDTIY